MPTIGPAIVIGDGIGAGSPFVVDDFLYVTSVSPAQASSYPGMRRGTNAIELPGTQAPNNRRNTVIGGNSINALSTDAIVIGWNNTAGTASSPVTAHVVIGSTITGATSTAIIAIGGAIADGGSTGTVKIGSGMGGLHNNMTALGFSVNLGGASNGVVIGNGASTAGGGNNAVVVGAGSSGQTNVVVVGQGSTGHIQNVSVLGNGVVISGGGGSNNILLGHQMGNVATSNAISLGNGATVQTGVIAIGNCNLGALGYSTSVLWGGESFHANNTAVPAWAFNHKNAQGTNIAAGDVTWTAPLATGTGLSANIVFRTGAVVGAGTGQATATAVLRITNAQKTEVMLDNSLTFVNQTSAAAGAAGTLTNAPTAGDPAFWLRVIINGVNSFIPCWQ